MRWWAHLAIGGALGATFGGPAALPAALVGSTAPDWLEWCAQRLGGRRRVKHRGATHYLAVWLALAPGLALLPGPWSLAAWFAWGGLAHVCADALTVSGVPVGPWSDRRVHFAGGRIRTGGLGEWLAVALVCGGCLGAGYLTHAGEGWRPYQWAPWGDWAEAGLIDRSEWRANRWRVW